MDQPVEKAPAIGVSVTCNINGDRQVVLQSFIDRFAPLEAKNNLLDGMMGLINRQKAIYDLVDLEVELEKHETTLRRFVEDRAVVDENHARALAELDLKIEEVNIAEGDARKRGYDEHVTSGRTGAYAPKGAVLQDLNRLGATRNGYAELKAKAEAEKAAAVDNLDRNADRYREEIERTKVKIAKARETVGG